MEQNTIKVVICDDHAVYRQGVKYILSSKKDIEIIGEAEDGLKLLRLLKHVQPDIILLDINMPVMDGTVAIVQIKKNYPEIKVLVLSMQNTSQMIKIMMGLGADGYLTKNDDEEIIYTAIKNCIDDGRYINKRTQDVLIDTVRNIKISESVLYGEMNKGIEESKKTYEIESPAFEEEEKPKYKWIFKSIMVGLGVGAIIILFLYLYKGISEMEKPFEKYNPLEERTQ